MEYRDYIAYNAFRYGDKLAVHDLATGERYSHAGFDARVSRLAGLLRHACGIAPGDRIAILDHNGVNFLSLYYACVRLGASLVPLNWRLAASELDYIMRDAEPCLFLCGHDLHPLARSVVALNPQAPRLMSFADAGVAGALDRGERLRENHAGCHDDLAMIMYTSGTTGRPKGAMLTRGMEFWNAVNLGIQGGISPKSVNLSVMPMFHTAGLNVYITPTLHAGGTVLTLPAFDADAVLRALGDPGLGVTHFFAVPTAWQFLTQSPLFETTDFSRLGLAGVGGAPVTLPTLEAWKARGVHIQNGFGMTETGPSVTTLPAEDGVRKLGSIGKPLLHTDCIVARPDGSVCEDDEPGELWIRGPNVTPGYWRNPRATADARRGDWFLSGDIARRDSEGFLFLLDRAKDMYISGGENVYPAEVENVIMALDAVTAAAVIGVPDRTWGEVGMAIVTARPGTADVPGQVLQHCAQHLARFKCPRKVVVVDALPLTASGKVHKVTLRATYGRRDDQPG